MASFAKWRWILVRAIRRLDPRDLLERRGRIRFARTIRAYARAESEQRHRGGVIEFASIAARRELFERIARRLEDFDRPIAETGMSQLRSLLAEPPPFRDYGPAAEVRNERIASILADLEVGETDMGGEQVRSRAQLAATGRPASTSSNSRWARVRR